MPVSVCVFNTETEMKLLLIQIKEYSLDVISDFLNKFNSQSVQGPMVQWLGLWTLNPAIRVQISVGPGYVGHFFLFDIL